MIQLFPDDKDPGGGETDIVELFRIHRDYLNHEHDLINQRLGWNLTIQGFLFAARWVVVGKITEMVLGLSKDPIPSDALQGKFIAEFRLASYLIAILGVGVSVGVIFSILAALASMQGIYRNWESAQTRSGEKLQELAKSEGLPRMMGGGNDLAVIVGFYAPLFLPTVLGLTWLYLLFY